MSSIQDEWNSDAKEILEEIPKSVTVRRGAGAETSFVVLISSPMIEQNLETGGFLNSTSFDVKFLKSDSVLHPNLIIFGNIVKYDNKDFRIVAINDRPPSAWIIAKVQSVGEPA
jgi:hypothetical protein